MELATHYPKVMLTVKWAGEPRKKVIDAVLKYILENGMTTMEMHRVQYSHKVETSSHRVMLQTPKDGEPMTLMVGDGGYFNTLNFDNVVAVRTYHDWIVGEEDLPKLKTDPEWCSRTTRENFTGAQLMGDKEYDAIFTRMGYNDNNQWVPKARVHRMPADLDPDVIEAFESVAETGKWERFTIEYLERGRDDLHCYINKNNDSYAPWHYMHRRNGHEYNLTAQHLDGVKRVLLKRGSSREVVWERRQ